MDSSQTGMEKAEIIRIEFENERIGIETVVMIAKENGFWSVWMTVFDGFPEVRDFLRSAFPGTKGQSILDVSNSRTLRLAH